MNNKSFYSLVMTRLTRNIADSLFYMLAIWSLSEKSAFLTSLAMLCFTIPENIIIFFGPFIDRYNHKKILLFNTLAQVVLIIVLTLLLAFNCLTTIPLLVIIFFSTLFGNLSYEVEDTIVPSIVTKEKLVKANSILEISYTITDSIFNGVCGFLIATFMAFTLYKFNIILFAIPVIFLKNIHLPQRTNEESEVAYSFAEYKTDLLAGVKILFEKKVRNILLPLVLINFCLVMSSVAMPFLSRKIEDTAIVFGSLIVVKGVAGLLGAFLINAFEKHVKLETAIGIGVLMQGFTWLIMILGIDNNIFLVMMFFLSYLFFGATNILFTTFFQVIIPSEFLGRANTAVDAMITCAMPLGTLLAGFLLEKGTTLSIVLLPYGVASTLIGVYYLLQCRRGVINNG